VKISGEIMMRISHDLLSLDGKPEGIHKIYSHPQALGQCRKWLRKNYPSVPLVEAASTARAAQDGCLRIRTQGPLPVPLPPDFMG